MRGDPTQILGVAPLPAARGREPKVRQELSSLRFSGPPGDGGRAAANAYRRRRSKSIAVPRRPRIGEFAAVATATSRAFSRRDRRGAPPSGEAPPPRAAVAKR